MTIHQNLVIAIADGDHARFLRPDEQHELRIEASLDSAFAHRRSSHLGEGHHHEQEAFAHLVADQLNDAAAENQFETLVLVAPGRIMNAITGRLNRVTRERLVGSLEKDLIKVPGHELHDHLSQWLRPVTRVKA